MIMARKKRRMVIGLTILFLLIIILAILLTLYFTTDMFKSNKTLFEKYLLQGMAQISNLDDETHMNELNQLLENNKEQNVLKGNITYEENGQKDNVINNINLEITGQTDKKENYLSFYIIFLCFLSLYYTYLVLATFVERKIK